MEWQIQDPNELSTVIDYILPELSKDDHTKAVVLALSGDLGAGKTSLVKTLAKILGVTDVVTSPTFVVMKKYETTSPRFTSLIHIDAYRIQDDQELNPLHFAEIIESTKTLICIEWAELIAKSLPKKFHQITICSNGETKRTVSYEVRDN